MKLLKNKKGVGFISVGFKILISVVIGTLTLGGVYTVTKDNVLPTAKNKIESLFDYSSQNAGFTVERITGDVDGNGTLDDADMQIVKNELLNPTGDYDLSVLDINGDGNFDTLDLIRIKKMLAQ